MAAIEANQFLHLVQTYESVIASPSDEWKLAFLVVPRRSVSVALGEDEITPEIVMSGLNAAEIPIHSSDETSVANQLSNFLIEHRNYVRSQRGDFPEKGPELNRLSESSFRFASMVVSEAAIPFEESPLGGTSIAALLQKAGSAGGATVGAYVGWVIVGNSPWLLITVPAGMVLCGAASGIASGLQQGLKESVSNWLFPKRVSAKRIRKSKEEAG